MNVTGCYSTSAEYDKRGKRWSESGAQRGTSTDAREHGEDKAAEKEEKEDYWRGRENIVQKTAAHSVVIPPKMGMEVFGGIGLWITSVL